MDDEEDAIVKRLSFSPPSFSFTPPPPATAPIQSFTSALNPAGAIRTPAETTSLQKYGSAGMVRELSAPVTSARAPVHGVSTAAVQTPAAVRYGLLDEGGSRTARSQPRGGACFRAPDDISDDDDDDMDGTPQALSHPAPIEQLIQQLQERWQALSLDAQKERSEVWQREFADTERRLAAELATIAEQMRQKEVKQREVDRQKQQQFSAERDRKLRDLQALHAQTAAQQQQQVQRLQRAAQAEHERAAAEEAARKAAAAAMAAAEAQRSAKEAAAAAVAAEAARVQTEQESKAIAAEREAQQQRQQQEAAQQAQEAEAAAAQAASMAAIAGPKRHPCERVAPDAAAAAAAVAATMTSLEQLIAPLLADESLKKQRRDIEKQMNVHVQQISATLEQIAKKCHNVYTLIRQQPNEAWSVFAMVIFVDKVMAQYELIQVNKRAAFPIATVLVNVSTQFPQLMQVTLAKLHQELPLTVPRSAVFEEGNISTTRYKKLLGMKVVEGTADSKVFEEEREYYKRLEGLMLLYGAIVQVDQVANPHGLDHGWRYLARFLNHLPADRVSAKALQAFLHTAGFGLHNRYQNQFVKLLKCMYHSYLPQLEAVKESEVQSVRVTLQHYLTSGEFKKEPEGHNMPKVDMSTFIRC